MDRREKQHLSVDISTINGRRLIKITGMLDGWHYRAVEEALLGQMTPAVSETDAIILDLSDLNFASIGGMYALVEALRSIQYDIKVYAVATGDVLRVLHRTRFDLRISLCSALDEAIALASPDGNHLTARLLLPQSESDDEDKLPKAA